MEIAMNKRAAHALLAGATGGFYTHSFAGGENENVAIQDLTLKFDLWQTGKSLAFNP